MSKYQYDDPMSKFAELQKIAEHNKTQRERIKGAMQQVSRTLQQRGFRSINAAQRFLKKRIAERQAKEKIANQKIKEITDKYDKYL